MYLHSHKKETLDVAFFKKKLQALQADTLALA